MKNLLLISNSTQYRRGFLDHVEGEIMNCLADARRIAFVPFAMHDRASYTNRVRPRFEAMKCTLVSVHEVSNPQRAIAEADAIFVGGGNTFRLLHGLYEFDLIGVIRNKIQAGAAYIGSSAGSIVACPSLRTTKDMPIVQPRSFEALSLVPFQISPHFLDADPASTHMGETQEERIGQFLEENEAPVIGLREGGVLRVEDGSVTLKGCTSARIFRRGTAPREAQPGTDISELLE